MGNQNKNCSGYTCDNILYNPMVTMDLNTTYDDYEPYISNESQSATLDYTLNAIPVSSGGNITVNGQQYISDYVDIENKKLVRMIKKVDMSGTFKLSSGTINMISKITCSDRIMYDNSYTNLICTHFIADNDNSKTNYCRWKGAEDIAFGLMTDKTESEINAITGLYIMYPIATPTEIDLTGEQVQTFKDLYTYSPTTVVSCSSDQLTPYVEFSLS